LDLGFYSDKTAKAATREMQEQDERFLCISWLQFLPDDPIDGCHNILGFADVLSPRSVIV
jgi:hypothetical protein